MNYKIAYAFLESHFTKTAKDTLEIFSEILILFSSPSNKTVEIINKIQTETGITIPIEVSKTLLKRLRKRDFIDYQEFDKYLLTKKGEDFQKDKITSIQTYTIENIENDLQEKGIKNSLKDIIEAFLSSSFVSIDFDMKEGINIQTNRAILNDFFKYLKEVKKNDINKYNTIIGLLYTGLLSKLLIKKDMDNLQNTDLKGINIYLDTNVIISLLGFHNKYDNITAIELLEQLKNNNSNIYVSLLTLEELSNVLRKYDPNKYIAEYPVDSIYYEMKLQKKSKTDINLMIENIDSWLKEQNIIIDYQLDRSNIKSNSQFEDQTNSLSAWKMSKNISSETIKHDVMMQLFIHQKRLKNSITFPQSLEKSKYIFLTSDYLLSYWNSQTKKGDSVPEIIHIGNMITYLWLKKPNIIDNINLRHLLGKSLNDHILSDNLWESFLFALKDKVTSGEITIDQCSTILAMEETKKSLFELQEDINQNGGNPSFSKVLSEATINEAKTFKEKTDRKIEGLHIINIQTQEKQSIAEEKLHNIKNTLQKKAEKQSGREVYLLKVLIFIVVCSMALLLLKFLSNYTLWKQYKDEIQILGTIIVACGALLGLWKNIKIENIFDKLYNKRVQNLIIKKMKELDIYYNGNILNDPTPTQTTT